MHSYNFVLVPYVYCKKKQTSQSAKPFGYNDFLSAFSGGGLLPRGEEILEGAVQIQECLLKGYPTGVAE